MALIPRNDGDGESMRTAEHREPQRTLLHISDTHLRAGGARLFDLVDGAETLARTLTMLEGAQIDVDAIVFTGDLADLGQSAAYSELRRIVDPFAARLDARVVWVMGNHDDRAAFHAGLFDDPLGGDSTVDRVDDIDGLRIVTLDSTVPGHHHGEISDSQLEWLEGVLAVPAPLGTILTMHHPPIPSVLPLAASVELRDQHRLAPVLRGSDVRAIIAGHLHYSTFGTFAGIPVSVASSTCYVQDLTVPIGGSRPQDGARSVNLVRVHDETVVHAVISVEQTPILEHIDAAEARRRLALAGIAPRTDAEHTETRVLVG